MAMRLLDFLKKTPLEAANKPVETRSHVMVIDGTNRFIGCFCASSEVNYDNQHVGGLQGFLMSLGSMVRTLRPTKVIVVFDGVGGSTSRRNIFPEYKMNRDASKVMNLRTFFNKEEEEEALDSQCIRLVDYLRCLPVSLVCLDFYEADDVIGFINRKYSDDNSIGKITLVSSDKDFLQLVNHKTQVYNPIKKKIYSPTEVVADYNVHPTNFLTYRTFIGDISDNVPNAPGIGEKTILKFCPNLTGSLPVSVDSIIQESKNYPKQKKHQSIVEFEHQSKINLKLMDLSNPYITDADQESINEMIDNKGKLNPSAFYHLCIADKLRFNEPIAWSSTNFNSLS